MADCHTQWVTQKNWRGKPKHTHECTGVALHPGACLCRCSERLTGDQRLCGRQNSAGHPCRLYIDHVNRGRAHQYFDPYLEVYWYFDEAVDECLETLAHETGEVHCLLNRGHSGEHRTLVHQTDRVVTWGREKAYTVKMDFTGITEALKDIRTRVESLEHAARSGRVFATKVRQESPDVIRLKDENEQLRKDIISLRARLMVATMPPVVINYTPKDPT